MKQLCLDIVYDTDLFYALNPAGTHATPTFTLAIAGAYKRSINTN